MESRDLAHYRVKTAKLLLLLLLLFEGIPSLHGSTARNLSPTSIVFPLMAPKLSSEYGMRRHPILRRMDKQHNGVDLAAPEYAHVRSVAAGVVVFADSYRGYGKLVTIKHEKGYTSLYGHLSEILVNTGQTVRAGELIGRLGSTGMSTGPHLHFEWRLGGKPIDPLQVFPALADGAEG